ncbi:uncharacterized protein LOC129594537 isoform X2 [Paramacrobiotus metropolitanus]|uniref:uncharacterized protein LOC129594537 isoform X2 n=1 Tax=Paramacrobiotus metropolitanus TaxID=2943436 RepID=UPI00244640BA|nr:uncharacterized protein LOC129594537 isoform X2 [Paramacrobiotus metropolitanus]
MNTVEDFIQKPSCRMLDKLEVAAAIIDTVASRHDNQEGGFDFRPHKVVVSGRTAQVSVLKMDEIDSDYVKYHHEEAVRALLYAAPEIIAETGLMGIECFQRADVWGFGCLLLYLISETHPLHYATFKNKERRCLNYEQNPFLAITIMAASGKSQPDYQSYCGDYTALLELFASCFRFEPTERESVSTLRNQLLPACAVSFAATPSIRKPFEMVYLISSRPEDPQISESTGLAAAEIERSKHSRVNVSGISEKNLPEKLSKEKPALQRHPGRPAFVQTVAEARGSGREELYETPTHYEGADSRAESIYAKLPDKRTHKLLAEHSGNPISVRTEVPADRETREKLKFASKK